MPDPNTTEAARAMDDFAERTGLTSKRPPQRYLWTDAFAVCNYLGLARATGDDRYTGLARSLVDQVHHTLGRHREDDRRSGWISGLGDDEGERHPTRGGLRIGKPLPERQSDEPLDERREWDRDGQYFHYLTRWMHALDQMTRATGDPRFNAWARELAVTAQAAFSYRVPGAPAPAMYWKMSIDLSHPLVTSMGQHDPLDGYVTALQLRATLHALPSRPGGPDLGEEIRRFASMLVPGRWATADPLGIGGLLVDAGRVQQLGEQGVASEPGLLEDVLDASRAGLEHYLRGGELGQPARYRLAFRELGLSIGLHALQRMRESAGRSVGGIGPRARASLESLGRYASLAWEIESFWRESEHRRADTWSEHRDINEVMLATSLVPDGYLRLAPLA